MFKPAPNACGSLQSVVTELTTVIVVDSGLYAYLSEVLGVAGADHTYLRLGNAPTCEYIRVTSVSATPNELVIERGMDDTEATTFAVGADIEYVLTAEAVEDIVSTSEGLSFTVEAGNGIAVASDEPGVFVVSLETELGFVSSNGSLDIVAEDGVVNFVLNPNAQGCCGS